MAATNELMIERGGQAGSAARRRPNFAIFSARRLFSTVLFSSFVLIDIAVSFTDLSRSLRVTKFTTEHMRRSSRRSPAAAGHRPDVRLRFRHAAIFNVTSASYSRSPPRSISKVAAASPAGMAPARMSPSVLYILLWLWAINPSELGC